MHEGKDILYSFSISVGIQILNETVFVELTEKLVKHGEKSEKFMEGLSHYC